VSCLVVSLDFEMFWGVKDSKSISDYRVNLLGVWDVVPKLISVFEDFQVKSTWATVGQLMCDNYEHWLSLTQSNEHLLHLKNDLNLDDALIKANEKLFFALPLVREVLKSNLSEIATHTFFHMFCNGRKFKPSDLKVDLELCQLLGRDLGVEIKSIVFPRNQFKKEYLEVIRQAGIHIYRGNPKGRLYSNGHFVPCGKFGRASRFLDSYLPITSHSDAIIESEDGLINVPASNFFRPYNNAVEVFERLKVSRIKRAMTEVARKGGVYHLWWHPHNFGGDVDTNLSQLRSILRHFKFLESEFGMETKSMCDFDIVR